MTTASSRQLAALRLLRRRLLQAVPLMLGVVVINFVLIHLAPGSFLELTAENQVSDPATVELLRKTYGLEDPTWLQLLKYFWALAYFDSGSVS
jgi:peptide/nickel transport system permease protein